LTGNEETIKAVLAQADKEAKAYFAQYVEKPKKAAAKAGSSS
jgi:hypothetical protein